MSAEPAQHIKRHIRQGSGAFAGIETDPSSWILCSGLEGILWADRIMPRENVEWW